MLAKQLQVQESFISAKMISRQRTSLKIDNQNNNYANDLEAQLIRDPAQNELALGLLDNTQGDSDSKAESRRQLITHQMIQMGFQQSKVMALLYLNPLWADITSTDIAIDVLNDPKLHKFSQPDDKDGIKCAICDQGLSSHDAEQLITQQIMNTINTPSGENALEIKLDNLVRQISLETILLSKQNSAQSAKSLNQQPEF